jgi:hypothetical protein
VRAIGNESIVMPLANLTVAASTLWAPFLSCFILKVANLLYTPDTK